MHNDKIFYYITDIWEITCTVPVSIERVTDDDSIIIKWQVTEEYSEEYIIDDFSELYDTKEEAQQAIKLIHNKANDVITDNLLNEMLSILKDVWEDIKEVIKEVVEVIVSFWKTILPIIIETSLTPKEFSIYRKTKKKRTRKKYKDKVLVRFNNV